MSEIHFHKVERTYISLVGWSAGRKDKKGKANIKSWSRMKAKLKGKF